MTLIRKSFKVPEGAILPNVSTFDSTSVNPSGLCHFMQTNEDFYQELQDVLELLRNKGIWMKTNHMEEIDLAIKFIMAKNQCDLINSLHCIGDQNNVISYMEEHLLSITKELKKFNHKRY